MNAENRTLIEKSIRIFNKYMELETMAREYCSGITLFPSEVHTIEAIGKNPNLNVTELAARLGVTKGTISKALKKLENKGLIERFKKLDNKKEVFIWLTEDGKRVFNGHEKFHLDFYTEANKYFKDLDEKEKRIIEKFLMKSEELLDDFLK